VEKFSILTQFSPSVSVAPWTLPTFSVGVLGALWSDGSEDAPAGSAVLSSGVVVGVNGVGLSSTVVCWWLIVVSNFVYDLQADKSPVVVKGPFFPRVVNPRYRIRGTNAWHKSWSSKAK
jgi:hypothetical protein